MHNTNQCYSTIGQKWEDTDQKKHSWNWKLAHTQMGL